MRDLIARLSEVGIRIELRQDQLHVTAPPGALTDDLRAELSRHRDALVERLRMVAQHGTEEALPVVSPDPSARYLPFPLNDVQHAYWIGRSLNIELGGVATHVYFEFDCEALDVRRLEAALQRVIARHDMLRAVVDGDGRQRVLANVPALAIGHSDLRDCDAPERERRLLEIRQAMSQQVISCERWPLYEVRLASLDAQRSRLCVSWDFLMVDAWSMLLIFRQWHAYYRDPDVAVAQTLLTFRDYVLAEATLKQSEGYSASRTYWWDRIDTLPLAPQLPVTGLIETGRKHLFSRRRLRLPRASWDAIKRMARGSGVTLSSTLLAAFCAVVDRWSKSPHYSLNLTLFNRQPLHPDVAEIVGDFTNLLALEVDGRDGGSFLERCLRIQRQFLHDFQHRQVSAVEVMREIARRRNIQQKAVLPVVFTSTLMLDGSHGEDSRGLECFGPMNYGITQTPQVWLDHQIFEVEGDLVINWDAVEAVFLPGVLDDMFEAHCELLRRLADFESAWHAPTVVPLPPAQQRAREDYNSTAAPSVPGCLHEPIVAHALREPARTALQFDGGSLCYGDLLAHADALAAQLLEYGARPNQLVAVVMPKGWEQAVAVLAILLAGAAYLPIDPAWPLRRRELLLQQAEIEVVLTLPSLDASAQWPTGVRRIPVAAGQPRSWLATTPPLRQGESDLAYVIFTSGSTGTPKGVMIDHRGAVNTVMHINRLFGVTADDAVLAVSELTFDLSVYDLFGLLSAGGRVVLPAANASRDPVHWAELIGRHGVTIWNSAPQLMGMLADAAESPGARPLATVRQVLLSGDWVPTRLPGRIATFAQAAQVTSLGGATEGSIWSIYYPIDHVDPEWKSIPYGRPLPNQHMHVLDAQRQECPELVTGDIHIGGVGVALGYWKDAEKTARQFITAGNGRRLYRTGDLGRYRRDGTIEFLGREDSQVKLRGHRVELGEISAALQSHPAIREVAVRLLRDDGRTALIAYVIPAETAADDLFDAPVAAAAGAGEGDLAARAGGRLLQSGLDHDALNGFARFWRGMEQACLEGMLDTLRAAGLVDAGYAFRERLDQLQAEARLMSRYRRLAERWRQLLLAEGRLRADGEIMHSAGPQPTLQQRLGALRADHAGEPVLLDILDYVESCLRQHADLLSGTTTALQLLFPDGSWRHAESLYQNNPAVRHHNRTIAAIVAALADACAPDRTLRILEVGAGTGGTSSALLPVLAGRQVEYVYSDISSYFFTGARQKFSAAPFVRYCTFDIDKDAAGQGQEAHTYDVIVAANVSHNARHLGHSLAGLRGLLKPGGHLIMLEGTRNTYWQFATVAFLEVADEYSDERVEQDAPALEPAAWRTVLQEAGFVRVDVLPSESTAGQSELVALAEAMPQHVIVARGPAEIRRLRPERLSLYLAERLPEHMIPQRFVQLERFPLSANGKVDLDALPAEITAPGTRMPASAQSPMERTVAQIWSDVLGLEAVSTTDSFFELGGDSLLLTEVLRKLNAVLPRATGITDLFAHPTVRSLADFLDGKSAPAPQPQAAPVVAASLAAIARDIAVIGMAARFPDAPDIAAFWQNLRAGHCAVRQFSDEELLAAGVSADELALPGYVRAGVVLPDLARFDAAYFGVTPREAQVMDPQQRLLLECAAEALDHSGYPDEARGGRIGVFAGKGTGLYLLEHVLQHPQIVTDLGLLALLNSNEKDYAAPLLSYKLNLTGPSLSINTACSTSLVAVHMACASLLAGECEMALAGGVSLVSTLERSGHLYQEGHILSRDGYCRPFSDAADGCVFGSGVGLVVLKPLQRALADRDVVHAVIKGSSVNNDGAFKVGFTAPAASGQAKVIADAQARAGVSPDSIGYVEAHGTGTHLGDPIEFSALREVFGGPRADGSQCALGSVKSNVGHLDSAAGVAGLIKMVLALSHRVLPPTLHAAIPNRNIAFSASPFFLVGEARDWPVGASPRRAGVSAFGVGGTNAHVVLEEAPAQATRSDAAAPQLLALSAKTPAALRRMQERLARWLDSTANRSALADIAYTLQLGRHAWPVRACLVCDDLGQARDQLIDLPPSAARATSAGAPTVVVLLAGEVPDDLRGIAALCATYPAFRDAFETCIDAMDALAGWELRAGWRDLDPHASRDLAAALGFAQDCALLSLLDALGVRPSTLLGVAAGEYAAAYSAGVFSLEEALSLVIAQAQLLGQPGHAAPPLTPESATEAFRACVAEVLRKPPALRLLSAVHGDWLSDADTADTAYWTLPARRAQFDAALQRATQIERVALFDGAAAMCPGRSLSGSRPHEQPHAAATREGDGRGTVAAMLKELGKLWIGGVDLDWQALHPPQSRGRVALPGAEFESTRFWLARRQSLRSGLVAPVDAQADEGNPYAYAFGDEPAQAMTQSAVPLNAVQAAIVEIWRDCLGIQNIGLDDNFFELGGDSLLATRVYARMKSEFDVDLPVRKMFEIATVRHLYFFVAVGKDLKGIDALSEQELTEFIALLDA